MSMSKSDAPEALAVLTTVLTALQANAMMQASGAAASTLYYTFGAMESFAPSAIEFNWLGLPLSQCFYLARVSGITLAGMAAVRAVAQAQTPTGTPAKAVALACARFALIQEAQILAQTTFVSSGDVNEAIAVYNTAFDRAQTEAADAMQIAAYRSLVTLHAAMSHDLSMRALQLPSMIRYSFGRSYTAVGLAQRLFGDPTQAINLVQENKVPHPYFMPLSGSALALAA
jgi:prophage DNA circulation protein